MGEDIPYVPNKRTGGVCIGAKIAPLFFNTLEDSGPPLPPPPAPCPQPARNRARAIGTPPLGDRPPPPTPHGIECGAGKPLPRFPDAALPLGAPLIPTNGP